MSVNRVVEAFSRRRLAFMAGAACATTILFGSGCEMDSFFDPSRTGYFEWVPTTMPVLKRIDVIETSTFDNAIIGPPEPEDLIPGSQEYIFGPGDVVVVEIYELVQRGETEKMVRTIDPDGYIRLAVLGSVPAAGLSIQELTDKIKERLVTQNIIVRNPIVSVTAEETRSYQYKVMGAVERGGLFALNRPDLKLTDALALASGAYPTTQKIRIVRSVQDVKVAPPDVPVGRSSTAPSPPASTSPAPPMGPRPAPASGSQPAPDIESLIEQLNIKSGDGAAKSGGAPSPTTSPAPPAAPPPAAAPPAAAPPAAAPSSGNGSAVPGKSQPIEPPSPGLIRGSGSSGELMMAVLGQQPAPIDVDSLEPVRISDAPRVEDARRQSVTTAPPSDGTSFVFDQQKQEWVRVRAGTAPPPGSAPGGARTGQAAAATRTKEASRYSGPPTRVIEISYNDLINGVPGLDVVIRPGDLIYCDSGERGVVYIDGEVNRPGVYQLPEGGRLTVSRLIAAAGGLNQIAIPQRCDLIRKVGEDREATVRISVAAIRNRGEPDIYCKPDDHVIIGTNFWATPLAVIRNGFRMTYGFGFLLDRNFGNDVFGAPPVNVVGE